MTNSTKILICIWLIVVIAVSFRAVQKSQFDRLQKIERIK